jgi:RNA polymerase sigma factor (sigma-70 family)
MAATARSDADDAGNTIAALFDAHARMVLGLCSALLRDLQDAEDAAQQSFLSAYRALLRGTVPADAPAWLATIARNECRQRISRRIANPAAAPLVDDVVASAGGDPVEQVGRRAEVEVLTAAIAELPERQREAVVLRDFYGLSYQEVSAAMSVSPPAVESLLSRARRRLEERVGPVRLAPGVLVVPPSLQEQLAQLVPGFAPAAPAVAAGGGIAAIVAKIVSTPVVAKTAAAAAVATLAVGADVAVQHRHPGGARTAREPLPSVSAPARPVQNVDRPASAASERRTLPPADSNASRRGRAARRPAEKRHRSPMAGPSHFAGPGPAVSDGGGGDAGDDDGDGLELEIVNSTSGPGGGSSGGSGTSGSGGSTLSGPGGSSGSDSSGSSRSSGSSGSSGPGPPSASGSSSSGSSSSGSGSSGSSSSSSGSSKSGSNSDSSDH